MRLSSHAPIINFSFLFCSSIHLRYHICRRNLLIYPLRNMVAILEMGTTFRAELLGFKVLRGMPFCQYCSCILVLGLPKVLTTFILEVHKTKTNNHRKSNLPVISMQEIEHANDLMEQNVIIFWIFCCCCPWRCVELCGSFVNAYCWVYHLYSSIYFYWAWRKWHIF